MLSKFEILLFDFEGTLVDFQWDLKGAVNEVTKELIKLGFDPALFTKDNYASLKNRAITLTREKGLDEGEIGSKIDAIYDRYDFRALSRWSLKKGVKILLSYLKDREKLKLGLVTNVGKKALEEALTKFKLEGLLDIVITRNDVKMMKPKGEGIEIAIERLGGKKSLTLFIGDSIADVLAAKDAGVKVALVQGGESNSLSIAKISPTYLWRTIEEVRGLFSP